MKIAVLNEPYFPKQKLQIKINAIAMQYLEMENQEGAFRNSGSLVGQRFGIVQKMDKTKNNSFAKYGTVCQVLGEQSMTVVVGNGFPRRDEDNRTVKAIGMYRFKINKVISRDLDGLIMTCEVTCFYEEGSQADQQLTEGQAF